MEKQAIEETLLRLGNKKLAAQALGKRVAFGGGQRAIAIWKRGATL